MAYAFSAKENHLLAALPESAFQSLLPDLEPVSMPLGGEICESGSVVTHVYFPTTAVVSLLYVLESGASVEVGMVGKMGMVGTALFLGGDSSPILAVVQSAGRGFRLKSAIAKAHFDRAGPFMHLALRYTQALITQIGQVAACNRHHRLDKRLCRWLLQSLDRLPGPNIAMTQVLLANALGVRREAVTEAALKLQQAGLIQYGRGRIEVLDRQGLEHRSCECYQVIRTEFDRLLPALKIGDAPDRHGQVAPMTRAPVRRDDLLPPQWTWTS